MAIVKISSKGQICIPARIRKAWGIEDGGRVRLTLSEEEDRATIEPLTDDPVEHFLGKYRGKLDTSMKEFLDERRRERDREEDKIARLLRDDDDTGR